MKDRANKPLSHVGNRPRRDPPARAPVALSVEEMCYAGPSILMVPGVADQTKSRFCGCDVDGVLRMMRSSWEAGEDFRVPHIFLLSLRRGDYELVVSAARDLYYRHYYDHTNDDLVFSGAVERERMRK
jgi:hypothetical protein